MQILNDINYSASLLAAIIVSSTLNSLSPGFDTLQTLLVMFLTVFALMAGLILASSYSLPKE